MDQEKYDEIMKEHGDYMDSLNEQWERVFAELKEVDIKWVDTIIEDMLDGLSGDPREYGYSEPEIVGQPKGKEQKRLSYDRDWETYLQ